MKLKVFTLRFDPLLGAFDDEALENWQLDKDVLDVSEHLFHHGGLPVWTFLIRYTDGRPSASPRSTAPDHRAVLPEVDQPLFDALRRWRNDRAQRDEALENWKLDQDVSEHLFHHGGLPNRWPGGSASRRPVSRWRDAEMERVGEPGGGGRGGSESRRPAARWHAAEMERWRDAELERVGETPTLPGAVKLLVSRPRTQGDPGSVLKTPHPAPHA